MPGEWDGYCAICASRDHRGDVRVRQERAGGGARVSEEIERMGLCTACFGFVAEAQRMAAAGPALVAWPGRSPAGLTGAAAGSCGVCGGSLAQEAFTAELVPRRGDEGPRPLRPRDEEAVCYRLCRACLVWAREVIDGESLARWGRRRAKSAAVGQAGEPAWVGSVRGLEGRDEDTVRAALESVGGHFHGLAQPGGHGGNAAYFVQAGAGGGAAAFVAALAERDRWRTVVVAGPAGAADAVAALRLGAGDLLGAPLSGQQATGALERLRDVRTRERDPRTGLPRYRLEPRRGLPAHRLLIAVPAAEEHILPPAAGAYFGHTRHRAS